MDAAQPRLELVTSPQMPVSELEVSMAEFLVAIRQKNYSPTTIKQYRWHLDRLRDWLVEQGVAQLGSLSAPLLRLWGAGLYDNWDVATVKQAVGAARSWLRWCYEERLIETDLRQSLAVPKVKARHQRILMSNEFEQMIEACDDTDLGIRNAAICSLLIDSGLRAAELCRLRLADVAFEVMLPGAEAPTNVFRVISKGGDEKPGYFSDDTAIRLKRWHTIRQRWFKARPHRRDPGTVFTSIGGTTPGQPLTIAGLLRILKNLGIASGVALQ